jgi:hypothetical protein
VHREPRRDWWPYIAGFIFGFAFGVLCILLLAWWAINWVANYTPPGG